MIKHNKKLRILRIIDNLSENSPAYNQFSLPVADQYDISLCSYFKSTFSLASENNLSAPIPPSIAFFEGDSTLPGFFRLLKKALAKGPYDIIHAHTVHVGVFFTIANVLYRHFIPSTVYTFHSSFQNYTFRNKLLLIFCLVFFRKIVCCGQASYKSIPAPFRLLAGNRLCYVQNGVNVDRVDRARQNNPAAGKTPAAFTIVTIGRLIKLKNPLTMLGAFAESASPDMHFIFIGGGVLDRELSDAMADSGLRQQIEITGAVSRETVYSRLAHANLYLSTSIGEGLPISVLEAMACNCPVILSDIPPHREIAEGVDFIPLINPYDIKGFAREIKRFKNMSPDERTAVGKKCRALVEEKFTLWKMLKGYEDVYHDIMQTRRKK